MGDLKCLTTKEVARLCRVSDATIKRWQDAGLLQSERTSGGHRRFRAEEIARFQRKQQLGLKQCHGDESVAAALTRRGGRKNNYSGSAFFHSLLKGCEEAAANALIGEHLQGKSPADIFDDFVCPAMRQIGELWVSGQISVAREHLASRVAHNAVYKLRATLPASKIAKNLAMCCALEGDFHELPTHLAQLTIENEGWDAINFGASTPLDDLTKEVLRHKPEVICISAHILTDAEELFRKYKILSEQISKLNIPIVLGGAIFEDEQIRERFPAGLYARKFVEIARFVQNLEKQPRGA